MRVLYIISNPFYYTKNPVGGSISSGTGVINGLIDIGHKVDILTDDKMPTIEEDESSKYIFFSDLFIRKMLFKLSYLLPLRIYNLLEARLFRLAISLQLPEILSNNNYNMVYIRASHFAGDALFYTNKTRIPSILEVNKPLSMQPYNKPEGFEGINKKTPQLKKIPQEINQYNFASLISVDSTLRAKWITDFVDEKYSAKILINHNGVNQKLFDDEKNHIKINERIIVGMASSFRWYNDIDELMRIITKVINKEDQVFFKLFIGDTSKKKQISKKINEYNLESKIKTEYAIPLNKMPEKLSECEILLSHFNFHGVWPHNCSIKHLEYMSLGKPVVATDVGEVNFAIEHNNNGLLVKEGDEDGFAESIINLINNNELRERLGKDGRKKILRYHTWTKHVETSLQELKKRQNEAN